MKRGLVVRTLFGKALTMARDSKQSRKASKDSGETEGRHQPRKRRKGKDDGPGTKKEQPTTTTQETAAAALAAAEAELIADFRDA